MKPINIFFSEPDPDRWFKYDRYPRRVFRRIIRGRERQGGGMLVAVNLIKGLDKIGMPYRFNDYRYIRNHPEEIACIIGRHETLFEKKWDNPVLFGAAIYSHALECPDLFARYPNVIRFIVPGEWMREMFEPFYGDKVIAWPVGIDTNYWQPDNTEKTFDFLIYDKIRWEHRLMETELIDPIINALKQQGASCHFIKYGSYTHQELMDKLKISKAVIFLCEHETQGLAYQQILASNVPILGWDRGGYWQDPEYYPDRVKYQPVSSMPYWDERCGVKFSGALDFEKKLKLFSSRFDTFKPRDYILENLTLEICAEKYLEIYRDAQKELT